MLCQKENKPWTSIHPDIFPIQTVAANCYLVRSKQGALLIDTGLKGNLKAILKALIACRYGAWQN